MFEFTQDRFRGVLVNLKTLKTEEKLSFSNDLDSVSICTNYNYSWLGRI
jgi:hypothetical protein